MKTLLNLFFAWLFIMPLHAQERFISGKVSDETGLALPGVNVVVKGTLKGTTTNFDGLYQIMANDTDVLVFSYLG
ncbi:MAG TPA: carboxypeptidase-like regulatory domain-containing protein, partial [Mariniflexile sp.]|nr:carboxypeptidase-like regulatory domain-containing protein [Mariniflexile sp.]